MSAATEEFVQNQDVAPAAAEPSRKEELESIEFSFIQYCSLGLAPQVKQILEQQPTPAAKLALMNTRSRMGETPLIIAAGLEDEDAALALVTLLLEHGANIQTDVDKNYSADGNETEENAEDEEGYKVRTTALLAACRQGNIRVVDLFLRRDASLQDHADYNGDDQDSNLPFRVTALTVAAGIADEDKALALIQLLVETYGADIHAVSQVKDKDEEADYSTATTAFLQACKRGHIKVIKYFLAKDSSLAIGIPRGGKHYYDARPPLLIAAGLENEDKALALFELLLKHKADIHTTAVVN